MNDDKWPDTWAPYMTWSKHQEKATFDLSGSNLLPCTLDEFPEALSAVALYGRNDNGWDLSLVSPSISGYQWLETL